MVAGSPLFRGLPITLLMSGKESQDAPKQLDWAKTTLETAGFDVTASLIPGDAESIIAKTVKEQSIDMLIMGAFGHSPLRSLMFGSKTTDLLRSSRIPTLLLRDSEASVIKNWHSSAIGCWLNSRKPSRLFSKPSNPLRLSNWISQASAGCRALTLSSSRRLPKGFCKGWSSAGARSSGINPLRLRHLGCAAPVKGT
jgi:hypothetical protein